MKRTSEIRSLVLAIMMASLFQTTIRAQTVQPMVGEVFIAGNNYRRDAEIRALINITPGQRLSYPELKAAEDALVDSGLFKVDSATGVRPTVQVLDGPGQFKDILVKVEDLPPTLFEQYACPSVLAAIVVAMTLLAASVVWRHYRQRRAEW
jgi:outer membrane protein assembly factor BamA